jgi:NIPSNAP protein
LERKGDFGGEVPILVSQLRIYRIKEGRMDEWLAGWTRGVLPLRRKFGFRIDGAWVVPGENTFVWILRYDGPEGFESRDAAYYDSEDRKGLHPDPAPLIENAETHLMTPVLED